MHGRPWPRILCGVYRPVRLTAASCGLAAALALAGCSTGTPAAQQSATQGTATAQSAATRRSSPPPKPSPTPSPTPTVCARIAPGFPCTMRDRIREVNRYIRHLPGSLGIVIDDRATGAVWHNANASVLYPAASTIKLAMMTDLLLRNRAGSIHLTPADRSAMFQALYTSNDNDADHLWFAYENASFINTIRAFGMRSTRFTTSPYWGNIDTTARNLDNLMNYVLTRTPASIRNYLVYRLRHVSGLDQQWGVWGAGPQNHPGNKDGWEQDPSPYGVWITNTVGFAGPHQQYTVAIMYDLQSFDENGNTGFKYGTNKLTQIAAMLFQGHHTPSPHPLPSAVP
jgi:hypothetical protein